MRVRPYYLYQADLVAGTAHFRTPLSKGLEMIEGLQGHTTGYAVPTFAVDVPGGGGKIPLLPGSKLVRDGRFVMLKNYEGNVYRFPDS
jgi:lysine 2,3-aminomutase